MKLTCKILLLIAVALAMHPAATGQTYERSREVEKTFAVMPNSEIQIINKYGNIHVVEWEKDSVKFEVKLMIKGNKQSKIQKSFETIEIDFTSTGYFVIAQTVFASEKGAFWDEVSDLTNTIFSGSSRTQIDYKVYVPAYCPMKIDNKFGNVYMGNQKARADIAISNGDLKANRFESELRLEIDFGNVNIRTAGDAHIIAGYADVDIRNAAKLDVESKSSNFNLNLVEELKIESRRDNFNIEEVGIIKGALSFSDLKIKYFTKLSILTTNYGSLDFRAVSEDFSKLKIDARYTDLDLNFEGDAAFELGLVHSDKTDVVLPAGYDKVTKELINEKDGIYRTSGKIGSGTKMPVVEINIESGHVFITNY